MEEEEEENKTQQKEKEKKKMKKRMSNIKAAEAFSNNSICLGISAAHLSLSVEYVSVIYDAKKRPPAKLNKCHREMQKQNKKTNGLVSIAKFHLKPFSHVCLFACEQSKN